MKKTMKLWCGGKIFFLFISQITVIFLLKRIWLLPHLVSPLYSDTLGVSGPTVYCIFALQYFSC
jgi:hypothetical protein